MASSNVNVCNARYWYVLYPVWILNTTWNGEKFTFAHEWTERKTGRKPADGQKEVLDRRIGSRRYHRTCDLFVTLDHCTDVRRRVRI